MVSNLCIVAVARINEDSYTKKNIYSHYVRLHSHVDIIAYAHSGDT